jgi:hypothetical protein
MTANQSYLDANWRSSDWVELYNASDSAVDLSGCALTDKAESEGYVFADGTTLEAGGYLVVYCDGTASDPYYAPFSLSAVGGEELLLYSNANVILDRLVTASLETDASLARDETGSWQVSTTPSPGFENTQSGFEAYLASVSNSASNVRITEIMAANLSCLADADGAFYDWIELTNTGSEAVALGGYSSPTARTSRFYGRCQTGRWSPAGGSSCLLPAKKQATNCTRALPSTGIPAS